MSDPALRYLKRKLTNLSSSNPVLWMPRLRAGLHVDWTLLDEVDGNRALSTLNALLEKEAWVTVAPLHDARNEDENRLSLRLQRLQRARQLQIQERAVDDLVLAWPFVGGQWPDGTPLRTPFLFIPLDLKAEGKSWRVRADISRAFLNPAWLLAYARYTQSPLEESVFEKELGLASGSFREVLTDLYNRLKETRIDLNFNSDLFSSPFQAFPVYSQGQMPDPGLRLLPEAVLGLFPISDSLLLPDFEQLEAEAHTLESIFLPDLPPVTGISERHLLLPFASDGSQEACLRAIREGNSLVVQGPPGSGKSQLIANVVADAMASGKSVLVVCQKKVALEVIQHRLATLGLDRQIAMWSDFKKDLGSLYEQIAGLIELVEVNEQKNKSLSTVLLERQFLENSRELERTANWLEDLKRAWFDSETAGISWVELAESGWSRPEDGPTEDLSFLPYPAWQALGIWIDRYWEECLRGRLPGSFSARRTAWLPSETGEISRAGKSIADHVQPLLALRALSALTHSPAPPLAEMRSWEEAQLPQEDAFAHPAWESMLALPHAEWKDRDLRNGQKRGRVIAEIQALGLFSWPFPDEAPEAQLSEIAWIRDTFGHKPPGFGDRLLALFSSSQKRRLAFFQKVNIRGLDTTVLFRALPFFEELYRLPPSPGPDLDQVLPPDWQSGLDSLLRFRKALEKRFPRFLQGAGDIREAFRFWERFRNVQADIRHMEEALRPGFQEDDDWEQLLNHPEELIREWTENRDAIWLSDRHLALLPPEQAGFLVRILRQPRPEWSRAAEFRTWLQGQFTAYWLSVLEKTHPVLLDPIDQMDKEIEHLQALIQEKSRLSREMVCLRVEERAHQNLERNRLQNRITYRGLYHQVRKKRMRLPFRQLWESFGDELRRLLPCWLATPESVSATWPLQAGFDLVVFDEASQCFAERGIPAAARGKQLLVLGDDKQLPPHHLFATRFEEEENAENWVSGQDSLLNLARQFLPQHTLRGHYRSRFPELISFSNRHFYQGRLQVFPEAGLVKPRPPQVYFEKTEGIWQNQRNEGEALSIVTALRDWFQGSNPESVGVITFNLRQRDLLEDLLDADSRKCGYRIPESFFIKNIENVQGDERDHIWFSVGYAPGPDGRFPAHFGSLSQEGGENRLNVAITRARLSIRVFCSVWPEAFRVGGEAAGPALLRRFLEFTHDLAKVREIGPEEAQASWRALFPEGLPGSGDALCLSRPAALFAEPSMKAFFGLQALHWKALGYTVRFDFRHLHRSRVGRAWPGARA